MVLGSAYGPWRYPCHCRVALGWKISVKPTILLAPLVILDFIIAVSAIFFLEKLLGNKRVEFH